MARRLAPYGALAGFLPHLIQTFRPHRTRLIEYARRLTVDPYFQGTGMIFEPYLLEQIFQNQLSHVTRVDNVADALILDINERLPNDLLTRTDRATMGASIEARVPFVTGYVAELAASITDDLHIRGKKQKYLLKRYAERYVPHECLYRRKVGFDLPLPRWLRTSMKDYVYDNLNHTWQDSYFRPGAMAQVVEQHMNGQNNNADKIFAFLLLEENVRYLKSIRIEDFLPSPGALARKDTVGAGF